jgi:hypothetical protein
MLRWLFKEATRAIMRPLFLSLANGQVNPLWGILSLWRFWRIVFQQQIEMSITQ